MVAKPKPKKEKSDRPWIVVIQKSISLKDEIIEFPELNDLRKYYDVLGINSYQRRTSGQTGSGSVHFVHLVSKD